MSGAASPHQAARPRAAGADEYLTKTFDVHAPLAVVDRLLGTRSKEGAHGEATGR